MREIKYAFFLDFHTSPSIRNLGSRFQADEFARRLSECGVNFLTFPARCNMGMAYYDTQIGTRHYGLAFDLFGELVEACRKREIAVCAYFNGGISQEETRLHPEWQARLMHPQPFGSVTPFVRTACCNTAYHDHLIAMMCEVAEKYPVAGFFIDCMGASSCLCESCLEQMKKAEIPMCIATASDRYQIEAALSRCGMEHYFKEIFQKTPGAEGLPLLQREKGYGTITNCIIT